jgi:hypothetical protein
MSTVKIARRFNNLLEAVTELNVDLSYNREYALANLADKANYRDLSVVEVFCDEANQIWYVIKSHKEGLRLLHKYTPFHSSLSDSPFVGYVPTQAGEVSELNVADALKPIGSWAKNTQNRRLLGRVNIIAG